MAKQTTVEAKYYDTSATEPFLLEVRAYDKTFRPAWVKHGTVFACPEPAIDNVKIFRVDDYPKEEPKRKKRAKKVVNANVTE